MKFFFFFFRNKDWADKFHFEATESVPTVISLGGVAMYSFGTL
jgi:hypothetical protein